MQSAQAAPAPRLSLASGYDVIAAINQLRAANGLPAYKINASLMAAAQSHSDYMAAFGNMSHTGKGGSTPRSRALAFGFGGGAVVFVSENIATGTNLTASGAVGMWQGDSLHMNTMLSDSYTDVGAGVSSSGNTFYYALDAGYTTGPASSGGSNLPAAANTAAPPTQSTRWPTPFKLSTVQTATPLPDGSVFHIVQPGEVLITIAEAYKVELSGLLKLNGLAANTVIYPKQKLLIRPPDPTATVTSTPTKTPRPPTATRLPTRTPTLTPTSPPSATPTLQPAPLSLESDPLLWIIALLVVVGTGLVVAGGFLKRRSGS